MIETVRPSRLRRIRLVVAGLTTMLFGVAVVPPATARAGEEVFASVGTGELNGVYYPVGKAICEIVNRDLSIDGVRCSPETTPGSVYNIHAIQSGELEFGIVQADVNFNAYKGEGAWGGQTVYRSAIRAIAVSRTRHRHGSRGFAYSGSCRSDRPSRQCGQQGYRHLGDL